MMRKEIVRKDDGLIFIREPFTAADFSLDEIARVDSELAERATWDLSARRHILAYVRETISLAELKLRLDDGDDE